MYTKTYYFAIALTSTTWRYYHWVLEKNTDS